jgi:hypothetical protein
MNSANIFFEGFKAFKISLPKKILAVIEDSTRIIKYIIGAIKVMASIIMSMLMPKKARNPSISFLSTLYSILSVIFILFPL